MSTGGVTFDDFDNDDISEQKELKPFWTIKDKPEDEILDWLKTDWEDKRTRSEERIKTYAENLAIYKGIHFRSQTTRDVTTRGIDGESSIRSPKVVVNHTYDLVETRVSKMGRFRPAITVLPVHDEIIDKQSSIAAKQLIESRWGEADIDSKITELERNKDIFGECWIEIPWDQAMGAEIPEIKRALELGIKVPALGRNKQRITTEAGDTVTIEKPMNIGDVTYKIRTPDRVFAEDVECWDELENVTILEFEKIDEIKASYPDKQSKISSTGSHMSDLDLINGINFKNRTMVLTFWHKPTKFLPKGRKITYTLDAILEDIEFPYENSEGEKLKKLPFVRHTDIDIPGEFYARSFIRVIKQAQSHHNSITSAIARNHGLASAPKWVVPATAAVSRASLNNDITIVRYKGPVPPQLVTFNPTPTEIFNYTDKLRGWMETLSGVHAVSRGEPPAGIKAGIALQFLDEQENERSTTAVAKRNRMIVMIAQHTLDRMQQYYTESDNRLIRILGKDNSFRMKKFDQAILDRPYDIRIQNSSSLPQSRPTKTQTLIDLKEAFPTLLKDEQVLDLLDLAQDQKFKDITTIAVRAADSENEALSLGEEINEPQTWEDHIIHHQIHLRDLQDMEFKENFNPEITRVKIEHVLAHEALMYMQAKKNRTFAAKVAALSNFPVFYIPSEQDIMVLDQALGIVPPPPAPTSGKAGGSIGGSGILPDAIPEAIV